MWVIRPLVLAMACASSVINANPVSSDNSHELYLKELKGYWSFDYENAIDHSGNELEGAFDGEAFFDKGVSGKAISINIDDENYLQINPEDNWTTAKPFAVALWLKPSEAPETPMSVLSRISEESDAGLVAYLDSELFLHIEVTDSSGGKIHSKTVSPLIMGDWQHLTINYDGAVSANSFFITINGFEAGLVSLSNSLMEPSSQEETASLNIGGYWGENDITAFSGLIDEIYLYQNVLNPSETFCLSQLGIDCLIPVTKGLTGEKGNKGDKGQQGLPGRPGETGVRGLIGNTGDKGKMGLQGLLGPDGNTGLFGTEGQSGQPGMKGKQGPVGPKGEKGLKGPEGPQGSRGDAGPIADGYQDLPPGSLSGYCHVIPSTKKITLYSGAAATTSSPTPTTYDCSCAPGWSRVGFDSKYWCVKN